MLFSRHSALSDTTDCLPFFEACQIRLTVMVVVLKAPRDPNLDAPRV